MRTNIARIVALLVVVGVSASAVVGQRNSYRDRYDDDDYGRGSYRGYHRSDRNQAGAFDYYLLALSWSPTYCAERTRSGYDQQCDRRGGRPYAFVLHGLWPQLNRGWPQDCRSQDRGWVPGPVADRMLDIMPSKKLIFHEYRKHGTCSGLGVDAYFGLARKLYEKVQIPPRFVNLTDDRLTVSPGELMQEFIDANPNLRPDMIVVQCGGSGNRLKEVRICFSRDGNFRSCGPNENQRRLCSAERMYVPPVRASAVSNEPDGPSGPPREIVPLPK
jgi:ribonuclease T2